jgi:hypothetical protein
MPIYRALQTSTFAPEHIAVITAAFEAICQEFRLAEREDPLRDLVAKKILECAEKRELDLIRLKECAREALMG